MFPASFYAEIRKLNPESRFPFRYRPFDVQLIGGMVLHEGKIAEMKTGEGKTVVATLPSYLNGLDGKGVHVVTVNDYLARRDALTMGKVYKFLGLSVGIIVHGQTRRRSAQNYACDISYGTNNEFGFDYLRDNMAHQHRRVRAARAELRHRGRSGFHPGGRSAYAPHHLGPGGAVHREVQAGQRGRALPGEGHALYIGREGKARLAYRRRRECLRG